MPNSQHHHIHQYHTLADRKIRLATVLLEIIIAIAGGGIFAYLGMYLFRDKNAGQTIGGAFVVIFAIVQIILMVNRSQTLGKYIFNIQVINNKTGKRVGFWRYAILRTFIGETLVIGAIPIIGWVFQPLYFIADSLFIFRKDRRTLHDLIGGTSVINLPAEQRNKSFFSFSKI